MIGGSAITWHNSASPDGRFGKIAPQPGPDETLEDLMTDGMTLEEEAIALLLRSPRLDVGTIIDLLDVSDLAFREMVKRNARIASLMEERRAGALPVPTAEPAQCPACEDWFVPYASARFCSDACRDIGRIAAQRVRRTRSY
jgi:hypothetical protein